jgi:threonyl-tRNA synthetase
MVDEATDEAIEKEHSDFKDEAEYKRHCIRHSTSHVMAEAIGRLFPEASFAIGPAIEDGFYYDIDVSRPITEDDLARIEEQMRAIVKRNSPFRRQEWSKEAALAFFGDRKQRFKLELIVGLPGETVTIYDQDGFVDLCRGPHVARTGNCKHFKLLKVSGAYWRGDAKGPQLQRVYGTAWPTREELDAYLARLDEAKKRDHRKLGRDLDLFFFHEYAPGVPFFLPRGELVYHELCETMRDRLLREEGYVVVRTPQLYDKRLWETSGHWSHYEENMFTFTEKTEDGGEAILGLKPMNCPCHMLVFGSQKRSYRELPYRIHDQGVLHRNEVRGALGGMTRVRQLCQDDAHLFVTPDQITDEVIRLLNLVKVTYGAFGMDFRVKFATRPPKRLGDDALWDKAEQGLRDAMAVAGTPYELNEGDGAFYGPKLDFDLVDAIGRAWQCATIQLDYQLPHRFGLRYVGADNTEHEPVVIHRAIFGSIERFMAILIEHYAGAFPVWLAPEQVRVMTVSERSIEHGRHVADVLKSRGVRVSLDERSEKISYKIRECHLLKVPYMLVIGEKESASGDVAVRSRTGDEGAMSLDAFLERFGVENRRPF